MCSGCRDGESRFEEGSTFGFSSPRLPPIFGPQRANRRKDYQTWGNDRCPAGDMRKSRRTEARSADSDAMGTSIYYKLEDPILEYPAENSQPANDARESPAEILVTRHVIVEVYREVASRNVRRFPDGRRTGETVRATESEGPISIPLVSEGIFARAKNGLLRTLLATREKPQRHTALRERGGEWSAE